MENKRIKLIPPSLDIQPKVLSAILESKSELEVYLPWIKYSLTVEESLQGMKSAIKNFEAFKNELRYFLINKENDELLGAIGLVFKDGSVPSFEIGYWLKSSSYGKGYISEAIGILERYAFEELGAKRLEIRTDETNIKSKAVALRCGYNYEGTLYNERRLPSGQLSNTLVFSKLSL